MPVQPVVAVGPTQHPGEGLARRHERTFVQGRDHPPNVAVVKLAGPVFIVAPRRLRQEELARIRTRPHRARLVVVRVIVQREARRVPRESQVRVQVARVQVLRRHGRFTRRKAVPVHVRFGSQGSRVQTFRPATHRVGVVQALNLLLAQLRPRQRPAQVVPVMRVQVPENPVQARPRFTKPVAPVVLVMEIKLVLRPRL